MVRIDLHRPETPLEVYYSQVQGFSDVQEIRDLRDEIRRNAGLPTGGQFIGGDYPIGAKNIFKQEQDFEELAKYATAEGSAIQDDWHDYVDVRALNLDENIQTLLTEGAARPEEEKLRQAEEQFKDALDQQQRRDYNTLVDLCSELTGSDAHRPGPAIISDAVEGALDHVQPIDVRLQSGMTREFRTNTINELVDSLLENYGIEFIEEAVEECRELMDTTIEDEFDSPEVVELVLDNVERLVNRRPDDLQHAFELLEDLRTQAREDERQEIINKLQLAFAASFSDIDDAIDTLQERLERARGIAVQEGSVVLEKRPDQPPRLTIEGDDVFQDYEREIIARAQDALPLDDVDLPDFERIQVGRLQAVAGQLEDVDFSIGQERLDVDDDPSAEPDIDTPAVGPDAPAEPDDERPVAEQFAQDVIHEL